MVAASLQQREALDALAESSDRMNTATRAATSGWQESARAQSASMNAYHNAERAREQQVAAEQRAAEAAAKATAEFDRQQAELGKLLAAIDPVTRELEKLDSLQARLNAARGRGIDPDVFTTYNAKLQEQRDRLLGTSDAMAVAGISAGQYRQAMRQLPAQITDVVTSLASGMPLWMVAIQQGGQIKDSFGGVGATFQALGDQVKSFFGIASNASDGLDDIARGADAAAASANNAKTAMVGLSGAGSAFIVIGAAVAAAGVALALAYEKGSSEADELNKAIVLTGNYAGTTAGQLSAMAASLARANGTQYEAVAVLSEITATGKFTVDQIEQVATTSIAMQEATGKAVSDTVAEFSKLADEPVKASQQLNEKYHYLTASVYEQIAALDQQGDSLGAAQLAMDAYSQAMDERASQIVENLGTLETAWKTVAGVAKGAWDEMLGVGRTETPEERLEQLTKGQAFQPGRAVASGAVFGPLGWFNELRKAYQRSSMSDDERGKQFTDALQEIQDEGEKAQKARLDRYLEDEAIRGQQSMDKLLESVRTNKEKRDKLNRELDRSIAAIQAANPNDERLRPENIAAARKAIDQKYKDPKTPKGPSTPLDQSSVTEAKNRLDQLQTDFRNAEQKLQAQQRAGLLSYADYVAQRGELISQNKDQVTAAYEGEIQALEALRDKSSTTAAQRISLDQKIAEARNNMVKAQKKADADLEVLQLNEQGRLKKQAQAVKAYSDALQQQQDALALQGQRAAAAVGMGAQQRRLFDQRGSLDDRFAQQRLDLASQYGDGSRGMSLDEYNDKLKALEASHAAMTQQLQRNYADLQAAQGNWVNGATSAFADYIDSARDVAGQTYELFSNAFSGLEDAVVTFVTTGKASLDDFVRTMIGDLARMATRQLGASLLSGFGLGGGTDGGAQGLTVGASAVSASAGALATAGGTLLSGAAAIQAAAASLAAANGVSGVTGAAGAAGAAGVAGGGSGWLSSITSIFGFAGGGQVQGPGTPTSDSIPAWLSNNEVVIRSASAMQPGLTPLLLDINQRGWAALHDWAGAVRRATGGVAGIPAPSLPRPSMGAAQIQEPSKNFSASVSNAVHLHAVQDPDQMAADMWAGKGGDHYIVWLNKNRQAVKQILGN
ncbi:TPA: phage tail tape measure protein [Pseudomonas aeruginosa]|nr:phage tail tape measure protein [Pseudomonas aeruginosa]HBO0936151.1 phage tail tape measure protein [Pseudomonas aeruginosa]HBO1434116.1 phage tail tape measure protein [Pseudomonas aeruginosa]HCI2757287.1 phage tail tape measure protein [Pseudomonas aeruginosa]HEJ2201979.1 phage tail tape measure protein [Pseudomonas aeruginosa]